MANNDMMNVSATDEMEIENNSNVNSNGNKGRVVKGITTRAENRLKRAFAEFGKAVAAFLEPVKKFIIIGIIIAVIVFIALVILAGAYKYILEIDSLEADDKKTEILKEGKFLTGEYLYGYKGQNTDLEKFAETVEFFLKEDNQVFTRVATTSRAKKITTLDNFLLIGDSRYDGLDVSSLGNNIKNAGVGSSNIGEWIKVAKNKGQGTVQKRNVDISGEYAGISIQLGANSVGNGANNAISEMESLLTELKALHPNTPIFVNSCIQVHPKANSNGYSWNPQDFRDRIDEFNNGVEDFCENQSNIYYIDVNTDLNDDEGYLKSEYTFDGLHCNSDGNNLFLNNIKNAITKSGASGNNSQNKGNNKDNDLGERTTETIKIQKNDDDEYCIVTKIDEKVDKIYDSLKKEKNLLLKQFKNEKQAKESIKLWIIAEYSTQYLNLDSDVEDYKHDYDSDYIQGIIKVKRYGIDDEGNETAKYLTYKPEDEFNVLKSNYETNEDTAVFDYFTINSKDDLVIATYEKEIQTCEWTDIEDPKNPIKEEDNYTKYTISERKLNYRDMILPYTMPYFLFVTLTMYGEDAEFANDMAKLAIDSEMVIGVRDDVTTEVITTVDKYLREEKSREYAKVQAQALGVTEEAYGTFFKYIVSPIQKVVESRGTVKEFDSNEDNTKLLGIAEDSYYEKTTVYTRISNHSTMNIEYVYGWCFDHKMEYKSTVTDTSEENIINYANTEYQTIKAYEDGKIVNETDPQKIQVAVANNENLKTVYDEAVNKIKKEQGTNILTEHYNRTLVAKLAENSHKNDVYKVLAHRDFGLVDLMITGGDPNYDAMDQEYFRNFGIELEEDEVADFVIEVQNTYVDMYNYDVTHYLREDTIDNAISKKIIEFGTEKQERIVNRTETITTNTNKKMHSKVSTKTTERTDKDDKNFVGILCDSKYKNVKYQLTGSTADWFFDTLEKNAETTGIVDLLKYLFYKATNNDYGVTEFDFNFNLKKRAGMHKVVLGRNGLLSLFIKAYESTNTRDGGMYHDLASEDDVYLIHSYTGDPTIGFGIYIAANLGYFQEEGYFTEVTPAEWSGRIGSMRSSYSGTVYGSRYVSPITNYHEYECNYYTNQGKPLYNIVSYETYKNNSNYSKYQWEKEVNYIKGTENTSHPLVVIEHPEQIVPNEVIQSVHERILENMKQSIKDILASNNIELEEYQIDALVGYRYVYGNINGFVSHYYNGTVEQFFSPLISKGNNRYKHTLELYNTGVYKDAAGNELVPSQEYESAEWAQSGIAGYYTDSRGRTYTLYKQEYGPWAGTPYWDGTIGGSGCGMVSTLIVMSGYGTTDNPQEFKQNNNIEWYGAAYPMKDFVHANLSSYNSSNSTTEWRSGYNKEDMVQHLKENGPIIILCHNYTLGNGIHKYGGHYFTILDVSEDESQVFVGDSGGCMDQTTGWHDIDTIIKSGISNYLKIY